MSKHPTRQWRAEAPLSRHVLELPSVGGIVLDGEGPQRVLRSREWFEHLIRRRMGHDEPRYWQVDLTMNKYGGRDVFVIVPTGSGKSTVILAPLLAALELGETKQAIVIVPTKALAQDHVS